MYSVSRTGGAGADDARVALFSLFTRRLFDGLVHTGQYRVSGLPIRRKFFQKEKTIVI